MVHPRELHTLMKAWLTTDQHWRAHHLEQIMQVQWDILNQAYTEDARVLSSNLDRINITFIKNKTFDMHTGPS